MKKILIAVSAAAIMGASTAYADNLTAVVNEDKILITQSEGMPISLIAACYDANGALTYAGRISASEGVYQITPAGDYETIKLYDIGVKSYDVELTAAPQVTEAPEATATPAPTSAPKPTVHPAYEKEADAVSTFAVVKKVVSAVNADNEEIYVITCLFQGKEITVEVAADIVIKSAPDAVKELKGNDASALREGDVIYYETNIAGNRVRGINLIYRPTDVFEGGSEFYSYFSTGNKAGGLWDVVRYGGKKPSGRYSYAFGVVTEKYDNTLILYPQSGLADEALDIDFTDNTIIYTCDMEGKPELAITRAAGIKKSRISKAGIDEDDNITYSDDYTYSLALVRLVEGEATDIVVYQNLTF